MRIDFLSERDRAFKVKKKNTVSTLSIRTNVPEIYIKIRGSTLFAALPAELSMSHGLDWF